MFCESSIQRRRRRRKKKQIEKEERVYRKWYFSRRQSENPFAHSDNKPKTYAIFGETSVLVLYSFMLCTVQCVSLEIPGIIY
jgi:hypothetical protein